MFEVCSHNGVWTSGQAMNINQEALCMSICQEFKNTEGAWPSKYDKTTILAFDKKSKEYIYLRFNIKKCSLRQFKKRNSAEAFVLVYDAGKNLVCIVFS